MKVATETLAAKIERTCQLSDKYSAAKKKYAGTESSFNNTKLKKVSLNIISLTDPA